MPLRLQPSAITVHEERDRMLRVVHLLMGALSTLAVIGLVFSRWWLDSGAPIALCIALGFFLAGLWGVRLRNLDRAIQLLFLGLLALIITMLLDSDGMHNTLRLYPAILAIAALLLNRRSFIATAVVVSLAIIAVFICKHYQLLGLRDDKCSSPI